MHLCIRQPLTWRTASGMLSLKPTRTCWKRKNLPLKGNTKFSVVSYVFQRFWTLTYTKHSNLCIAGRSSKCLSWNSVSERVSCRSTAPSWDVEPLTLMCVCWDYRSAHMHVHRLFLILYQNISMNHFSVCMIGSPAGKRLFAGPVCRAQRLLYQGEARSGPETGCSGIRDAPSERVLEREQWKTCRGVEETRGEGEHIQASSCDLPHMTRISLNWCLNLHCGVLYYKDPQSGQAHQQLEKEVPEGVGAEQRKTAADWDARAISGWPPHHGRLPGPAEKGTALSDVQPTKQKPFFPVVSEQLLIMLSLRSFSCVVLPDTIIASTAPIYHTCGPIVFFILK